MQCYTDLIAPTAVTHTTSLPFISASANNLIVVRLSRLQIFEHKELPGNGIGNDGAAHSTDQPATGSQSQTNGTSQSDSSTGLQSVAGQDSQSQSHISGSSKSSQDGSRTKLVLHSEYTLSGIVTDISPVKIVHSKSGGKALLISFRDAKMSLISWDPELNTISTESIHYYEGEGIIHNPISLSVSESSTFLTVDPNDRCAALKFGTRHVAVLPFKRSADDMLGADFDHDFDEMMDRPGHPGDGDNQPEFPFLPSFVVPLTVLDPALNLPIHFAFLHGYREPTFGILYAKKSPSTALLLERRDPLCYAVHSLDLEKRTSTSLLSVTGLPYDLAEVVPLPLPIGGTLIIGTNELVHVDQSGKALGVAVNVFARETSTLTMSDQSDLDLRLEGCVVQPLGTPTGDLLVALKDGNIALLTFQMDGRSVSQLNVQLLDHSHVQDPALAPLSCSSKFLSDHVFFGSIDGDSVLLKWIRKASQAPKKRPQVEVPDPDEVDFDGMDDDDDDLYATKPKTREHNHQAAAEPLSADELFLVRQDTLPALAPIHDFSFRPNNVSADSKDTSGASRLDIYAATGTGAASSVAVLSRVVTPTVSLRSTHPAGTGLWATPSIKAERRSSLAESPSAPASPELDQLLFISRGNENPAEPSIQIRSLASTELESKPLVDFDPESGPTIEIGLLAGGTRVVQVLDTEIKTYDSGFDLAQIMPIEAEDGSEVAIRAAAFCDPYLMLLRSDSAVLFFTTDSAGELDEGTTSPFLQQHRWVSGCFFRSPLTNNEPMAFLLSGTGTLAILGMDDLTTPKYIAERFGDLPKVVTGDEAVREDSVREPLCEILVAELGPSGLTCPYLIARNIHDDLFIYKPFHYSPTDQSSSHPIGSSLRWQKVDSVFSKGASPKHTGEPLSIGETRLRSLSGVSGYSLVVRIGSQPAIVTKEVSSTVRTIGLATKPLVGVTSVNSPVLSSGFACLDHTGAISFCTMPEGRIGDTGWVTRKLETNAETRHIRYHAPKDVFAIGTSFQQSFKLPSDEYHPEWEEETTDFLPQLEQGTVKLMDGKTWTEIDSWQLDRNESIVCMEVVETVVSEVTLQRKSVIAVGTAVIVGEDLALNGHIYIFDVIDVVPKPGVDKYRTNRRLKLLLRESVKGAVTAISEIGTQGLLSVIHGQKCMVRGLKEDGTFLPTAFMDLQCYVPSAKTIPGTGLMVMADALKGVWFVGYTEDPYQMILFGKSKSELEIMVTEFLPFQDQLFILAADADGFLHMFEFAPEDPRSVSGQRLLERSSFFLGNTPTRMQRLPSVPSPSTGPTQNGVQAGGPTRSSSCHHVLASTEFGGLWVVSSVPSEGCYRNLHALQNHLTANLDHPCGLNPRAHRQVETDGFGSRGILDGNLLRRWHELTPAKRADSSARVGAREAELRRDLEVVVGGLDGLGYL